jgi:hypothetical protein
MKSGKPRIGQENDKMQTNNIRKIELEMQKNPTNHE